MPALGHETTACQVDLPDYRKLLRMSGAELVDCGVGEVIRGRFCDEKKTNH